MGIRPKQILVHTSLFVVTFITTTLAGSEWTYGRSVFMPGYGWLDFYKGMSYSIPFLLILTVHEFGHYFAAIHYKVKTTLPYFIPLPPLPFMIGTMGALIRLKGKVTSKQHHFDIGIAGPLAGFVVAIGVLWYGFAHLPPPEYIFQFHPEYQQFGLDYANFVYTPSYLAENAGADVMIGKNLLFVFFEKFVADPARIPNMHEIIHYPFLFAGFLSLVFTSINLLPIGQLDGGHVVYGLLGFKGHRQVASIAFTLFLFYAGLGYINPGDPPNQLAWEIPLFVGFLYLCLTGLGLKWKDTLMYALTVFALQYLLATLVPGIQGYPGWLLFVFIIGRFIGVQHPPSEMENPLTAGRKALGWFALLVFVICFAPNPLEIVITGASQP
ncbi:MAG: site-2 protease family protein [Cyclobacteriaceae bacterium]|nr:site-2 protease family protein [Cyclobacteriaceae bacterium]MCB0500428.1 site-2 protease family protein [Cyclobacteriaceae bacterium]MCB9236757.1 site-2 protease family protein [Flammeovirgaceae bacterium]MCO5272358.1 site-2 protease family protein [Cyclobacteriaceae bacterium]MCW5902036.1 site-2 protease family protein [Cyclobacteriaceae bacterium]